MIVAWMLAATLFALCVGLAALAVEQLLRMNRRSCRGVWLLALTIAVLWPLLVPVVRPLVSADAVQMHSPSSASKVSGALGISGKRADLESSSTGPTGPRKGYESSYVLKMLSLMDERGPRIGSLALALWAAFSALLFTRLLLAARQVGALTRRATAVRVDGKPLLLAESLGPASVGWKAPQVIVPSWVLSLDAPLRALVLRHEQEHCRANDPRLVWCASIANALVPWNPCIWWIARRLRLAIEMDCDARTIGDGGDRVIYAKLLLFMTQQHAVPTTTHRLASSLTASRSHLSRRIVAMQQYGKNTSRGMRMVLGTSAFVAILAACGTQIPGNVVVPEERATVGEAPSIDSVRAATAATPSALNDTTHFPTSSLQSHERAQLVTSTYDLRYPPLLRTARVEGSVVVAFIVGTDGRVEMNTVNVLSSDHEQFLAAVRRALATATYTPARVDGTPVRQRIQQPFLFALSMDAMGRTSGRDQFRTTDPVTVVVPSKPIHLAVPAGGDIREFSKSRFADTPSREKPPTPYLEHQVDKPASMSRPLDALKYPALLRASEVEGEVLAQFVVNTDGSVDMSTFTVVRSDHALFSDAVQRALPSARFIPAEAGGVVVRQLTQQPFQFKLAR